VEQLCDINTNQYQLNPIVNELMEASNDGFWDWNIETGEVYFSKRWKEMLGYEKEDIAPHVSSWEKLVHPEDMAHVMEVLGAHLKGETPLYQTEHRVRMKNGEWKWILDRGKVIQRDTNGKPLRAAGAHVDITEKKLLEAALELRKRFLSIASHELKTPLTSLYLISETALRILRDRNTTNKEERLESLLKKNDSQIKKLNRLIDEMLDVTRIETGKIKLKPEWFEIKKFILELKDQFSSQVQTITKHPLKIHLNENFNVYWDHVRIEQVLGNLITNAIKYGGNTPIEIDFKKINNQVTITISDQGHGIPKNSQDSIFRCFERANGDLEIQGLGLGLYISKEIIEIHQGKIWLDKENKIGAKFIIQLPIQLNQNLKDSTILTINQSN
jgi:PAS domain S-box-containing protein